MEILAWPNIMHLKLAKTNRWHLKAFFAIPRRNSARQGECQKSKSNSAFALLCFCFCCCCFSCCFYLGPRLMQNVTWNLLAAVAVVVAVVAVLLLSLPFRFPLARLPPDGCANAPITIDCCCCCCSCRAPSNWDAANVECQTNE